MKQIPLDDALRTKLKASVPDVVPENIAVFRAAALSTAPIRKKHPVFYGAVNTVATLTEMAETLKTESRPLQIMHGSSDGDQLPVGRVFEGEISLGTGVEGADELLTLFWIDKTHPDLIAKVNSGTIDQVSVAYIAKSAKSSKTGFDFMGPDATLDNVWGGVDDKGNKMGVDGAHVIMDGLDKWFEMSLVGQGGAVGAKILGGNRLQLSSGQDVPVLAIELSTASAPPKADPPPAPAPNKDTFAMDATQFATLIAANATELALANAAKTAAEAQVTALTAQITELTSKVATLSSADQATKLTAAEASVADLTTKLTAAQALPKKLLAPLFVSLGQTTFEIDADEAKAVAQVQAAVEGSKALGARLSGGLTAHTAVLSSVGHKPNQAFKRSA